MPIVYNAGDYISQIGRVKRSCKAKPDTFQIHERQKYLGVNAMKYLVNNVLFRNVMYLDVQEHCIGVVCNGTLETMQKVCDKLNRLGDVTASCFCLGDTVVVKIEPVTFVQVSQIKCDKHGCDLKNEIVSIRV